MRRLKKKAVPFILTAALCTGMSVPAYADDYFTDTEVGEEGTMQSQGQDGTTSENSNTTDKTEGSSQSGSSTSGNVNNQYKPTKNEEEAYEEKDTVKDILQNIMNQIKNDPNTIPFGNGGSGSSSLIWGSMSVPESLLSEIMMHVNAFNSHMGQGDNADAFYNKQNEVKPTEWPNKSLKESEEWKNLTQEEKDRIKTEICKKEGHGEEKQPVRKQFTVNGFNNIPFFIGFDTTRNPLFTIQYPSSGNKNDDYTNIRPELIQGGLQDSDTWAGRFNGIDRFLSNSMEDYMQMGYMEEYHVTTVEKNHQEEVDYTSDKRVWSVYNSDTGEKVKQLETNNPEHELSISFHTPGNFYVVAEQEAKYRSCTYVKYDICNYLFDMETGNLLYFNEKLVSNGKGGSVKVNSEEKTGLVPTGDTFRFKVNNLGEVEIDGNATQRVQ